MTRNLEHLHEMARGYITAALWADAQPLCTCGAHDSVDDCDHAGDCKAEESGGLESLEVRAEDYAFVFALCEAFADAAGDALDTFANLRTYRREDGTVWEHVGHDLRLSSGGHGTGFWDRDPDVDSLPYPSEQSNADILAFYAARNRLHALATSRPFDRTGGGDVWQDSPDICHFDWWSLDADAAPGARWEPPTLTSAQRQAWIEEGRVPKPEEMPA